MLSLLELPRELRDVIWKFYVVDWAGLSQHINPAVHLPNSPAGLLRVSRQVSVEVSIHFYGSPIFYLYAPYQSLEWIKGIGLHNARLIRNLILKSNFLSMDSVGGRRFLAVHTSYAEPTSTHV